MLVVNDEPLDYDAGMTVADVLKKRSYIWRLLAVFVNGTFVPRGTYDKTPVPDGADVKVIHQIAGG
ncbi:MAG: sulfur carrier protein ThiS [Acidobacteria bacterium]|nr:sulfur carrier protein ThiS [Acidobacteriota bacterium]